MIQEKERIVFCTLENTMLGPDGDWPECNLAAVKFFCMRGGRLAVLSQRSPSFVREACKNLPLALPGIVCGGALVYDCTARKVIKAWELDTQAVLQEIFRLEARFPDLAVDLIGSNGARYLCRNAPQSSSFHKEMREAIRFAPLAGMTVPIVSVEIFGKHDSIQAYLKETETTGLPSGMECYPITPVSCALRRKEANYKSVVMALCAERHITADAMAVIAGAADALPLMQVAAESMAVHEADAAVKVAAKEVSLLDSADGAAGAFLYRHTAIL